MESVGLKTGPSPSRCFRGAASFQGHAHAEESRGGSLQGDSLTLKDVLTPPPQTAALRKHDAPITWVSSPLPPGPVEEEPRGGWEVSEVLGADSRLTMSVLSDYILPIGRILIVW